METNKKNRKQALGASIALVIGVGLALGSSIGNYLVGIMIALPIGSALYYSELKRMNKKRDQ